MTTYIGNPYFGSNRKARIFTTKKEAFRKAKKVNGKVSRIGPPQSRIYTVKKKGAKFFLK